MKVAELFAELGFDLTGEADLRRFEAGLRGAEAKLTAFAAAATKLAAVAGAALGAAMVGLGKSVITTTAQFEAYEATLATIEGSSEKARESMNWVADFAKKTPYDLAQVTESFVRLKAYGIDPTSGTLEAVGNAASAMGKGLMQGVEAIADAATGEFERLKEFGIKSKQAGDQVTFSWSKNGQELTKTVKKNSTEIVKFLNENFGDRFNGAMIRQSKTWNGMVANLGDSWEDFKLRIGRSGTFEAVKQRLGGLLDYIDTLEKNGTLDRWARNIDGVFMAVLGSVDRFIWGFQKLGTGISEVLSSMSGGKLNLSGLQMLSAAVALLLRRFMPLTFWIGLAYIALDEFLGYLRGDQTFIGDFIKGIQDLTGASEGLAQSLAAIVASLGLLMLMKPGAVLKGIGKAAGAVGGAVGGGTAAAGTAGAVGAAGAGSFLGFLGRLGIAAGGLAGIGSLIPLSKPYLDEKSKPLAPNTPADFLNRLSGGRLDAFSNAQGNLAKMNGTNAAAATITDSRDQSSHVTVGDVNVTVQQATQAPAAVGQAIRRAVGESPIRQASRFEMEPAS